MTIASNVRLAATVLGFGYAAVLHVAGVQVAQGAKQAMAYIPSAAVVLALAFDKWLWRWWPFYLAFRRPYVHGTWWTTLRPNPQSHIPEGGNRGPIEAAVVIEQSCFSVHVALYTVQSASHSTAAAFRSNGESRENVVLAYLYANESRQEHRPRSGPHAGASELQVSARVPRELQGTYWTNRFTAGDMSLTFFDRRVDFGGFEAVRRAVNERIRAKQARD